MSGGDPYTVSCYSPIAGYPDYDAGLTSNGKIKYKLEGYYDPGLKSIYPDVIKIPCGRCLGCRLDYSRNWADRMLYELISQNGKGLFVTLTYDNDHVPISYDEDTGVVYGFSLCKRDLQLFFKRLRRHFSDCKIRYYSCGEYGSKTHRPHYHAIIFGLSLGDFSDCYQCGRNELGQNYFTSDLLKSIWQNGIVCLSDVSYKTCAYVSRYTMKKAFGLEVDEFLEKEFVLMSRRPGIGAPYIMSDGIIDEDKLTDTVSSTSHYFSDSNGSVKVGIPKYFLDKLKLTDTEKYNKIISDRVKLATDNELLKLSRTSLSYIDFLEVQQNTLLNKTEILFKRREEFNDET